MSLKLKEPYRPKKRQTTLVKWSRRGSGRAKSIFMTSVSRFPARGLRRIYSREDAYPVRNCEAVRELFGCKEFSRPMVCFLKMWQRKDGRLFIRFYTRRRLLDVWSLELHGLKLPEDWKAKDDSDDAFVPETVRDFYEEWVRDCLDYPWG